MTECLISPSRVRGSHDPFFSTVPGRLHAAPSPHPSPCPSPLRPRAAQPASPAFHPQLRWHPRHPLSGQSPLPQPSTPGGYQSSPTAPNNLGNPNLDPWRRPALIRLPAQRRCPRRCLTPSAQPTASVTVVALAVVHHHLPSTPFP
jgi:hypothetical protein